MEEKDESVSSVMEGYKYLGIHIDSKLDPKTNTETVYKKEMSRLFFQRKLRSFDVCSRVLKMFYQSVVASALFFAVVCWGSSVGEGDTNGLNKMIEKAGSVIGCKHDTFEAVSERRILNEVLSILDNPDHPLQQLLDRQWSSFSNRLIELRCHKDRYRKSFLPQALNMFNSAGQSDRQHS